MECYTFDRFGNFTETPDPIDPEIKDWAQAVFKAGWQVGRPLPNEFTSFSFETYDALAGEDSRRFVCINDTSSGMFLVICENALAYIIFVRDFLAPLVSVSHLIEAINSVE